MDPAREASIEAGIAEAQIDAMDDQEEVTVTVCAGWPRCELQNERARDAMRQGCPWCSVILVQPDGSYTQTDPPVV